MIINDGRFDEGGDADELRQRLAAFLLDLKLLADEDRVLSHLSALPSGLRDAMERAERNGQAWSAWRHDEEIHAISAEPDEARSQSLGCAVLLVFVHNASGRVVASGSWAMTPQGSWMPAHPHPQHESAHMTRI